MSQSDPKSNGYRPCPNPLPPSRTNFTSLCLLSLGGQCIHSVIVFRRPSEVAPRSGRNLRRKWFPRGLQSGSASVWVMEENWIPSLALTLDKQPLPLGSCHLYQSINLAGCWLLSELLIPTSRESSLQPCCGSLPQRYSQPSTSG